jgi:hypothetical protein
MANGGRAQERNNRSRPARSCAVVAAMHTLKHPIDCADVEVHVLIEAGAEAVDEGDCADVQRTSTSTATASATRASHEPAEIFPPSGTRR